MVRACARIAGTALLAIVAAGAQDSSSPPDDQVFRAGMPGVTLPEPVYKFEPAYTEEAREAGLQGSVRVSVVIDRRGVPQEVAIRKPLGMGLDERAVDTVQQWRFRPAMKDGVPVKFGATVELHFRLWRKGWSIEDIAFPEQPDVSAPVIEKALFTGEWSVDPGLFRMALRVDKTGAPSDINITLCSNPALEKAAVKSVRAWRFHPAMQYGQPVAASGTVDLSFNPEAPKMRLH